MTELSPNNPQQNGKLAPFKNDLKFTNDLGQAPLALGHFSLDQGFIAVASLVGAFVGAAWAGLPLAALVVVAGWNDILYARKQFDPLAASDQGQAPEPEPQSESATEVEPEAIAPDEEQGIPAPTQEQEAVKDQTPQLITNTQNPVTASFPQPHELSCPPTLELYNWQDLPKEATGVAILGDPGSGKSCTAEAVVGMASEQLGPAQVIVFNTHWKPGTWQGCYVIYEPEKIFQAMRWILECELKQRKDDRFNPVPPELLIWVAEELGDLFLQSKHLARKLEDEKEARELRELVPDFLINCGSQGRKYEFFGLIVNQSGNAKANGMDGLADYLEAYNKIFTGRVAVKRARQVGMPKAERDWVNAQAYSCTVDDEPATHLTHGHYKVRQKQQQPRDYKRANSQPLPHELLKLCDVLPDGTIVGSPQRSGVGSSEGKNVLHVEENVLESVNENPVEPLMNVSSEGWNPNDEPDLNLNPLLPGISPEERGAVVRFRRAKMPVEDIIKKVWGATKGGSLKYSSARGKIQRILDDAGLN